MIDRSQIRLELLVHLVNVLLHVTVHALNFLRFGQLHQNQRVFLQIQFCLLLLLLYVVNTFIDV